MSHSIGAARRFGKGSEGQAQSAVADVGLSREALQERVRDAIADLGTARELSRLTGVSEPYISRARSARSIPVDATRKLVSGINGLFDIPPPADAPLLRIEEFVPIGQPVHVQLCRFERFVGRMHPADLNLAAGWLAEVQDQFAGEPTGYHAQRLLEALPYSAGGSTHLEPVR